MLQQNIRLFLRSLANQKVHAFLTTSGLVLGLGAVLLAFTFIQDEQNFDEFHSKSADFNFNKPHN